MTRIRNELFKRMAQTNDLFLWNGRHDQIRTGDLYHVKVAL